MENKLVQFSQDYGSTINVVKNKFTKIYKKVIVDNKNTRVTGEVIEQLVTKYTYLATLVTSTNDKRIEKIRSNFLIMKKNLFIKKLNLKWNKLVKMLCIFHSII